MTGPCPGWSGDVQPHCPEPYWAPATSPRFEFVQRVLAFQPKLQKKKKKNLLTVYHETFWVGVKRGPVSLPTSKRRFDTISTSWSRLLAALPWEFDEVTQQVCPFVEGSLHLYYHVGSQHSWGMAGSVISRFFQRYVNIGPQDMTHFYQHLIWIQFCFRCHVIISIHWHFLNFLTDSNCTSQNVGIKLHQNWSPPSHSMIPHQVHRRPKDDHPQVWPIAPAIELSEFWSSNFFLPILGG